VFLFSLFADFGDEWHRISHIDPEIYEKSQELLNVSLKISVFLHYFDNFL